jgi:hypothetical protein
MRRTKEILRLRFESGLGLRQIAHSLSISVGTVHDYLQRAEGAEVTWPYRKAGTIFSADRWSSESGDPGDRQYSALGSPGVAPD